MDNGTKQAQSDYAKGGGGSAPKDMSWQDRNRYDAEMHRLQQQQQQKAANDKKGG